MKYQEFGSKLEFEPHISELIVEQKNPLLLLSEVSMLTLSLFITIDISEPDSIDNFVKESILMLGFAHPNVLKLLGVCFDTTDHLPLIVLPFMANGDLRSYLMSKRDPSVSTRITHFPEVIPCHSNTFLFGDV